MTIKETGVSPLSYTEKLFVTFNQEVFWPLFGAFHNKKVFFLETPKNCSIGLTSEAMRQNKEQFIDNRIKAHVYIDIPKIHWPFPRSSISVCTYLHLRVSMGKENNIIKSLYKCEEKLRFVVLLENQKIFFGKNCIWDYWSKF